LNLTFDVGLPRLPPSSAHYGVWFCVGLVFTQANIRLRVDD